MNRAILMGRLTRDPDVRYSTGERSIAIARYTLAVDRRGKARGEADFIRCVAFDRAGEFAEKYFRQGMRVLVSGRLQTDSYTNKDGAKVNTVEIVVDDQEFADSKGAAAGDVLQQARAADIAKAKAKKPEPKEAFMDIPADLDDDGLPFN